ncbi:MAG: nucleoside-diphosphate sugar epimerase/dehydratase [Patescibacteria group bacterium]|jgi:FlaA1/EpsC-like NDP-sugar epimerase
MNMFRRGWQENVVLAGDAAVIVFSYVAAYFIRFDGIPPVSYLEMMSRTLPFVLIVRLAALFFFKLNTSMWEYASVKDLIQIIKAVTVSSVFIVAITMVTGVGHPRSIFIIDWLLLTIALSGERFIIRLTRPLRWKIKHRPKHRIKALVVGAGDAGEMLLREIIYQYGNHYEAVGLVDDDPKKYGKRIHGIKVLGTRKDITAIVNEHGVEEIIIAIPSASGEAIRGIIESCTVQDVRVKIVPGLQKILNGNLEIKIRDVNPEDLLGRETIRVNLAEIKSYIKGRRVLVTGASGSIGSELSRQIAGFSPSKLILLDHNENDIYFLEIELKRLYPGLIIHSILGDVKDISLLKKTFSKLRPQLVFHAAAFKHVPLMEMSPAAAVKNNVISTRNLIYASAHYGIERFVFISSDKAVNASSIMGVTKRIGEMMLQARSKKSGTKFMAVRFGNVLGSKGSVVPLFKQQIERGGPVTVTHPDMKRYFMSAKEAVQLVLQAGAFGKGGEVFVLDMGEQIKIADLANNLIFLSGLTPGKDIKIDFIGLRPGEKLYEELLLDAEKDKVTKNNKIYINQPKEFNSFTLMRNIRELERLANLMEDEKIIQKIREIVPSYRPGKESSEV